MMQTQFSVNTKIALQEPAKVRDAGSSGGDVKKLGPSTYDTNTLDSNGMKLLLPPKPVSDPVESNAVYVDDGFESDDKCGTCAVPPFVQSLSQLFGLRRRVSAISDIQSLDEAQHRTRVNPFERVCQISMGFFVAGKKKDEGAWKGAFTAVPESNVREGSTARMPDVPCREVYLLDTSDDSSEVNSARMPDVPCREADLLDTSDDSSEVNSARMPDVPLTEAELLDTIDENSEVNSGLPSSMPGSQARALQQEEEPSPAHGSSQRQNDAVILTSLLNKLSIWQRSFGHTALETAKIHNKIGQFHFDRKHYQTAKASFEKASSCGMGVKRLKDCSVIARAYDNLSAIHMILGDIEMSTTCLVRSLFFHFNLVKERKEDPTRSLLVSNCFYKVAINRIKQSDYVNALRDLDKCLRIRAGELGFDHMDVACTLDTMGQAYRRLGFLDEAAEWYLKAVKSKMQFKKQFPHSYVMSLMSLAEVHEARNAPHTALLAHREIVITLKWKLHQLGRKQRPDYPAMKRTWCELGTTLLKMKDLYILTDDTLRAEKKRVQAAVAFQEATTTPDYM